MYATVVEVGGEVVVVVEDIRGRRVEVPGWVFGESRARQLGEFWRKWGAVKLECPKGVLGLGDLSYRMFGWESLMGGMVPGGAVGGGRALDEKG